MKQHNKKDKNLICGILNLFDRLFNIDAYYRVYPNMRQNVYRIEKIHLGGQ